MDRDWEKLRKWLVRRKLEGRSVTEICSEAQVDRKMFYRWWNRYQAQGWAGLFYRRNLEVVHLNQDRTMLSKRK